MNSTIPRGGRTFLCKLLDTTNPARLKQHPVLSTSFTNFLVVFLRYHYSHSLGSKSEITFAFSAYFILTVQAICSSANILFGHAPGTVLAATATIGRRPKSLKSITSPLFRSSFHQNYIVAKDFTFLYLSIYE